MHHRSNLQPCTVYGSRTKKSKKSLKTLESGFHTLVLGARVWLFAHVDDAANAVASLHVAKGLVDLIERLSVGDEFVDLEVSLYVVGHKARELSAALDTAESASFPHTTGNELEWAGGDLLASSRDANDDGLSPALVAGLESGAHDIDVASAIEGVVAAAIGHLDELILDTLLAELGRVDEVGRAELLCPCLLGIVDIDYDDLASLFLDGSLDD